MQDVVVPKPYTFTPPLESAVWPRLLRPFQGWYLRRNHGITTVELRWVERLRASIHAGHGVLLAPNHCRPPDPFVLGPLCQAAGRPVYCVASSHLFRVGALQTLLLRAGGAFSIYREGMDREALKYAIGVLTQARRPLVLFPEGVITRHNDRLNNLMDGLALITRSAAKQRAALTPPGRVVVHPIAIRYLYEGDVAAAIRPMLADIERRLTWTPQDHLPLLDRIRKVGSALLALKEIDHLGAPREGTLAQRMQGLIDHLLSPLEDEWLKGAHDGDVVARVKKLRSAVVPAMVEGKLPEPEVERRWRQLHDMYLAQQVAFYPEGYLSETCPPDRLLETVERFEEDLTDAVRVVTPIRALVDVGEAIEVSAERARGHDGDPLMNSIREQLESMLAASLAERRNGARLE